MTRTSRDLGPAREHLRLFLMQCWGGPGSCLVMAANSLVNQPPPGGTARSGRRDPGPSPA